MGPFGPTHEKARYLAEIPEVTKGHGVLRQDGKFEVVGSDWSKGTQGRGARRTRRSARGEKDQRKEQA